MADHPEAAAGKLDWGSATIQTEKRKIGEEWNSLWRLRARKQQVRLAPAYSEKHLLMAERSFTAASERKKEHEWRLRRDC
jgi:hypothetical protein